MKFMTKQVEKDFQKYGPANKNLPVEEKTIVAKFFYPAGYATWFATEYDPEERTFFGWAVLQPGCGEWGYASRDELEKFRGKYGLGIERDMHFKPVKVKDCAEFQNYLAKG